METPAFLDGLGSWLTREQPITLAVNEDERNGPRTFTIAKGLFERTSQVVYSVGGLETSSALTCQARPQVRPKTTI